MTARWKYEQAESTNLEKKKTTATKTLQSSWIYTSIAIARQLFESNDKKLVRLRKFVKIFYC